MFRTITWTAPRPQVGGVLPLLGLQVSARSWPENWPGPSPWGPYAKVYLEIPATIESETEIFHLGSHFDMGPVHKEGTYWQVACDEARGITWPPFVLSRTTRSSKSSILRTRDVALTVANAATSVQLSLRASRRVSSA